MKLGATSSSFVLAFVPVAVAVVLGGLILPRATPPGEVPLPRIDAAALARAEAADDDEAAVVTRMPLPGDARAAGEAIRAFNTLEASDDPDAPVVEARAHLDDAINGAARTVGSTGLLRLRAVQLGRFLVEVRRFEHTGKESEELAALAGSFLRRMRLVGWLDGHHLAMDEHALRVAFKLKWNSTAGVDAHAEFSPTLDEQRALYAFYLGHPHPPEASRFSIDAARRNARTAADCDALAEGQRMAAEQWRVEKIDKLAKLDPEYPAAYARGVGLYRAGKYEASARALEFWLETHPDGAYSLRARNYERAALGLAESAR